MMKIEAAKPCDVERIIELLFLVDVSALLLISGRKTPDEAKQVYAQHFLDADVYFNYRNFQVAKIDEYIVGCILFFKGEDENKFKAVSEMDINGAEESEIDEIYIDTLVVDPEYRGRGIAERLVQAVLEIAKHSSCCKVSLLIDSRKVNIKDILYSIIAGFILISLEAIFRR